MHTHTYQRPRRVQHHKTPSTFTWVFTWQCIACAFFLSTSTISHSAATLVANNKDTLTWHIASDPSLISEPFPHTKGTYQLAYRQSGTHLRRTGPSSTQGFSKLLNELQMPLLLQNINTQHSDLIAGIALAWSIDSKQKQVRFKLDLNARWSDGQPVTADDYVFSQAYLEQDSYPWLKKIIRQDDVLKIELTDDAWLDEQIKPVVWQQLISFKPLASHFHRRFNDWPAGFDDRYEPTTGAYHIEQWRTGKRIILQRTQPWWGHQRGYFQHRFTFEYIHLRLVADVDDALQLLSIGEIDAIPIVYTPDIERRIDALQIQRNIHHVTFSGMASDTPPVLVMHSHLAPLVNTLLAPADTNTSQTTSAAKFQSKVLRIGYYLPQPSMLEALVKQAQIQGMTLIPLAHSIERLQAWAQEPDTMQLDLVLLNSHHVNLLVLHPTLMSAPLSADKVRSVLYWPWLKNTHSAPLRSNSQVFYPWNLHNGGLLWVDPGERLRMLLNPSPRQADRRHTISAGQPADIIDTQRQQH